MKRKRIKRVVHQLMYTTKNPGVLRLYLNDTFIIGPVDISLIRNVEPENRKFFPQITTTIKPQ